MKLLSQGPLEVPESKDPIFRDALNRLRISRISPELLKALEEHMFDKHADEAIEAEIWLKAEAKGLEKGREQERAENKVDTETVLRAKGLSESMIADIQSELDALRQNRHVEK